MQKGEFEPHLCNVYMHELVVKLNKNSNFILLYWGGGGGKKKVKKKKNFVKMKKNLFPFNF